MASPNGAFRSSLLAWICQQSTASTPPAPPTPHIRGVTRQTPQIRVLHANTTDTWCSRQHHRYVVLHANTTHTWCYTPAPQIRGVTPQPHIRGVTLAAHRQHTDTLHCGYIVLDIHRLEVSETALLCGAAGGGAGGGGGGGGRSHTGKQGRCDLCPGAR